MNVGAALLPYLRHRATCLLNAVRDNPPWDESCTCGLAELVPSTTFLNRIGSLAARLGPFPNDLDVLRFQHSRQETVTPDDFVDVACAVCYMLGEGWPCTVARLIEDVDAQIAEEAP